MALAVRWLLACRIVVNWRQALVRKFALIGVPFQSSCGLIDIQSQDVEWAGLIACRDRARTRREKDLDRSGRRENVLQCLVEECTRHCQSSRTRPRE